MRVRIDRHYLSNLNGGHIGEQNEDLGPRGPPRPLLRLPQPDHPLHSEAVRRQDRRLHAKDIRQGDPLPVADRMQETGEAKGRLRLWRRLAGGAARPPGDPGRDLSYSCRQDRVSGYGFTKIVPFFRDRQKKRNPTVFHVHNQISISLTHCAPWYHPRYCENECVEC